MIINILLKGNSAQGATRANDPYLRIDKEIKKDLIKKQFLGNYDEYTRALYSDRSNHIIGAYVGLNGRDEFFSRWGDAHAYIPMSKETCNLRLDDDIDHIILDTIDDYPFLQIYAFKEFKDTTLRIGYVRSLLVKLPEKPIFTEEEIMALLPEHASIAHLTIESKGMNYALSRDKQGIADYARFVKEFVKRSDKISFDGFAPVFVNDPELNKARKRMYKSEASFRDDNLYKFSNAIPTRDWHNYIK